VSAGAGAPATDAFNHSIILSFQAFFQASNASTQARNTSIPSFRPFHHSIISIIPSFNHFA
jgi:hypothetical protein